MECRAFRLLCCLPTFGAHLLLCVSRWALHCPLFSTNPLSPLSFLHQGQDLDHIMPTDKPNGKAARQLLFSEALTHHKSGPSSRSTSEPELPAVPAAVQPDPTMERILQEITAVGRTLEGTENKISELVADTHSIRADIAGFHNILTSLDHRITLLEDKLNTPSPLDQELQSLRDKLADLEDRS
ncbi:hypothetical protein NDU88_008721 [Pleurodeles waltl]|uniref:Uncharacterized protein n=1 Tax=Pleurodeles waltl TaxID=8319 RepID=A0AAV7RWK7_PLEWA|nr:hypothetical protein NDU88_008721 [Pleurodeles waltl]